MYTKLPNLIIGFHGCDIEIYNKVIVERTGLIFSDNKYDWLGNGIYFWEQNLKRAWEWAEAASKRPESGVREPAVVGAVLDLGFCLNLLDSDCIKSVKNQFVILEAELGCLEEPLPKNKAMDSSGDFRIRDLDCAVIQSLHQARADNKDKPYDSVRGVFWEGDPIYDSAGFCEQNHIQICIRNPNCIKGYFSPISAVESYEIP